MVAFRFCEAEPLMNDGFSSATGVLKRSGHESAVDVLHLADWMLRATTITPDDSEEFVQTSEKEKEITLCNAEVRVSPSSASGFQTGMMRLSALSAPMIQRIQPQPISTTGPAVTIWTTA